MTASYYAENFAIVVIINPATMVFRTMFIIGISIWVCVANYLPKFELFMFLNSSKMKTLSIVKKQHSIRQMESDSL